MNDQKIQLECRIQINGGLANTDIYELTHELNRNILSAFDYRQPNDLLIAICFLIGSFFFLSNSLEERGTWLFIVGSIQLLIKPLLKLASLIHVRHVYFSIVKKSIGGEDKT